MRSSPDQQHASRGRLIKDTISVPRYSTAAIGFAADNPGDTLFHCHHQDQMDEGFAGLITCADNGPCRSDPING